MSILERVIAAFRPSLARARSRREEPRPGPTRLDRVIAYLAPRWGARRAWARQSLQAAQAFYDGATAGRRGASIRRFVADPNTISMRDLPRLRTGSRDLVANNPHAKRAAEAIVSELIGIGIGPQFLRSEERAEELEALADLHLETRACDSDGLHTYQGLQVLAAQTIVESGEVLVRRRWRRTGDGLPVPVQFQVLEPDFLDVAKDGAVEGGGQMIQGVEFDALGRRRAYWLFDTHPGSRLHTAMSRPIPARDVAHIYRCDRPGQVRGIPWLAAIMLRIADFCDYEDAQLMRQKIAACFVGFVKESFDGTVPPTVVTNDAGQLVDQMEPGMIERLPPGTEIEFGSPPPASEYEPYVRTSLRTIAAGMGISYEALTGDLRGVNFSSGKMGRLAMERNVDRWRHHMFIPQFCSVLMGWFLEAAELAGVDVAGITVRHIAPRRELIDPPREIPAEKDAIRAGLKTLTQAIRERGRDPVEHLREMARDNELLDDLGLRLDSDPRTKGQPAPGAPPAPQPSELEEAVEDLLLAVRNGRRAP